MKIYYFTCAFFVALLLLFSVKLDQKPVCLFVFTEINETIKEKNKNVTVYTYTPTEEKKVSLYLYHKSFLFPFHFVFASCSLCLCCHWRWILYVYIHIKSYRVPNEIAKDSKLPFYSRKIILVPWNWIGWNGKKLLFIAFSRPFFFHLMDTGSDDVYRQATFITQHFNW